MNEIVLSKTYEGIMSAQNAASPGSGANSDICHRNAALLSIENELPPLVVSSDYFDEQLADTYKRLRMPKGLLERLAGISERRGWAQLRDRKSVV